MDKILVEIAAYRDPELLKTIESAMRQAEHPERVRIAVCYQGDELHDLAVLRGMRNCRVRRLSESETKGPCYARYICQQLIGDEDYVYQIDSHMRFVKHWDTGMIQQWQALGDPRATISHYPPNLEEGMELLAVDDARFDEPAGATMNVAKEFQEGESYFVKFGSMFADELKDGARRDPFIAAGNFFAPAGAHREVVHDPEMCWYGDELPMAVRLYTHGWNNYAPQKCYIYHKYNKKVRAVPQSYAERSKKELKRLRQLLNIDDGERVVGKYGLGRVRSLAEFEEYAGINFRNKEVREKAKTGQF